MPALIYAPGNRLELFFEKREGHGLPEFRLFKKTGQVRDRLIRNCIINIFKHVRIKYILEVCLCLPGIHAIVPVKVRTTAGLN
jgi:hypothetical protein